MTVLPDFVIHGGLDDHLVGATVGSSSGLDRCNNLDDAPDIGATEDGSTGQPLPSFESPLTEAPSRPRPVPGRSSPSEGG